MKLRDYQERAVESVLTKWETDRSTVVVLPTGCGKTVVFSDIIRRLQAPSDKVKVISDKRKVLVLAHREELIFQAKDKISQVTGAETQIEMGPYQVSKLPGMEPDVIVSTVQTQITGRMNKFDPNDFAAVIVDEAHHAVSKSYRKVIEYYLQNPACRLLGVTATPDRADETALGNIFNSVAFEYSVVDAINDGWLVPVKQKLVKVGSLDFSKISTTAGDFNQGELALILEEEQNLQGIAFAAIEICGAKRAIIFAASVKQAERLAEILNRHKEGSADWISGKTPKEQRAEILSAFKRGERQFVVNVGVLTEGFDDSGVEVVVMARPTKSRALYAQMAGRATRPAADIADKLGESENRRALIAASSKPGCLIVDFVGNSGKHKLITTLDILGGKELDEDEEEARRRVKKRCEEEDALNVMEELAETREQIKIAKAVEVAKRKFIKATAKYSTYSVDPFDIFDIDRPSKHLRSPLDGHRLSYKQKQILREKIKVDPDKVSFAEGRALIDEFFHRINLGLATFGQMRFLKKHGYFYPMKFDEASRIISRLKGAI